jgi:hypothetical protein
MYRKTLQKACPAQLLASNTLRYALQGSMALWLSAAFASPANAVTLSLAVDAEGRRVAMAGLPSFWAEGRSEIRVFGREGKKWVNASTITSTPMHATIFVGRELLIEGRRHIERDGRWEPFGEPIVSASRLISPMGEPNLHAAGSRVFVPGRFLEKSQLWRLSEDGAAVESELDLPTGLFAGSRAVATHEARIAILYAPIGEPCGLYVFERAASGWVREGPVFPDVCGKDQDTAAVSLAIDEQRVAIGAYPNPNPDGRAGQVAVHERGDGGWPEVARVAYPDQGLGAPPEDHHPYLFGHRVELADGRLYVGAGYKMLLEYSPGGNSRSSFFYHGVMVFVPGEEGWLLERHLVHTVPTASFGSRFAARGSRVFVDSPDEAAVYVLRRSKTAYVEEARLPLAVDAEAN